MAGGENTTTFTFSNATTFYVDGTSGSSTGWYVVSGSDFVDPIEAMNNAFEELAAKFFESHDLEDTFEENFDLQRMERDNCLAALM